MSPRRRPRVQQRSLVKRARIIETAMRHFAERGYHGARVEGMAAELGIAKGSIFQHFKTKEGLFLAVYKRAISLLPDYLDAPPEVQKKGFFEILRYWLIEARGLLRNHWVPCRVVIIGDFGVDLRLKSEITRFIATHDPYGTMAFVRQGLERGELRDNLDPDLIACTLHWLMESFQDALLTAELDPGLFRRTGGKPVRAEERIDQFVEMMRAAFARRP